MMDHLAKDGPIVAVVLGARGGIGKAFTEALRDSDAIHKVYATSRDPEWCASVGEPKVTRVRADITDEHTLEALAHSIEKQQAPLRLVINCTGLLHQNNLRPERRWRDLNIEQMRRIFDVNTFGVALAIKHLIPPIPRRGESVFATLSARVGSIGDNRIGGWYSYRASKAAQNMIVKTASIEAARLRPALSLVALHPGTVSTSLSEPFTGRLKPEHKVFTPEFSCAKLIDVISGLEATRDSGNLYAWDGARIPW